MSEMNPLLEAYNETAYQIGGHSKRDIRVLKESFKDIAEGLESDIYGKGKIIENFEVKMAMYLGKESAVFFPSGTMAQQIALRIWCDHKGLKKVGYHPLCHLEIHEEDGLKELHHIEPVLLANKDRLITLEDIISIDEEIACVLLELPQREIGGQLPAYKTLESISLYCRNNGIKLHLDGARLFEILPYYEKTAAEVCSLFDSVYVSLYKGIGGIAGAILAGDNKFTDDSKVWKRRHGGDLISLYPYIISADYYFNERIHKMGEYFDATKKLAGMINECDFISTRPLNPVSNMFHVHVDAPKDVITPILVSIYGETQVGLTSYIKESRNNTCYFEVSIGDRYNNIPEEKVEKAFRMLDEQSQSVQGKG
ncbi:threonine aldolase family protein [Cytobacillus sp. Hm23]